MDLKKKWKRFWTLNRHHDAGFTLVELIVVIAIMAILGGIGTAGYGGYIKATNKNADKKLVGDIMRAIETGTNSLMFVNDDSFKMGSISYPVGFIALSADGSSVVTSSSEMTEAVEGNCQYQTIENIVIVGSVKKDTGCYKSHNNYYTTVSLPTSIEYCTVHSPEPIIKTLSGQYISDYTHTAGMLGCVISGHTMNPIYSDYPQGTKTVENSDALYLRKSGNLCETAYANQNATFTGTTSVGATTEGPFVGALEAAFGSLDNLKLKYDGWKTDDGIGYATFYNSAPQLMDDIESLSGLLIAGDAAADLVGKDLGLSRDYANKQEVLDGVSSNITQTHQSQDSWMSQWNNDDKMTWDSYGFGLEGRENYSAARVAYNNGFASYLDAMDSTGTSPYSETIRDFNSQELFGVGLPGLVCSDAFTDTSSPLRTKLGDNWETVYKLYQDYMDSDAYTENGKVIYDTLTTFAETSDIAKDKNNAYGGDLFDYYNSYVDEIAALYNAAGTAAGDGIVIIVSVQDTDGDGTSETVFTVSPSAANPRVES